MLRLKLYISLIFILTVRSGYCQDSLLNVIKDSENETETDYEYESAAATDTNIYQIDTTITLNKFDRAEWKKIIEGIDYSKEPEKKKKDWNLNGPKFNGLNINPLYAKYTAIGIVILIVGLLLFVVLKNILKNKNVNDDDIDVDIENIEDIEKVDEVTFESLFEDALKNKDYKSATRILYILLVKKLHEHTLINWKKEKTNQQYLSELSGDKTYTSFKDITYIYERVWFSEEEINETQFNLTRQKFIALNNLISGN